MRLEHMGVMGGELALKFEGGSEVFLPLSYLRQHCPCAGCRENPVQSAPSDPRASNILEIRQVGSYALLPVWQDGHSTGIYSFDFLGQLQESLQSGDDPTT